MDRKPPSAFKKAIPPGDNRERRICARCDFIDYENPRIIVGSVVRQDEKVLLCRRAIEPRRGYWTLPAGFLEVGESPMEGAMREAYEEAEARIRISSVLAIYTVRHLSQVQIIHRARLVDPHIAPGAESLEVALFKPDDIPWPEIAFPSVIWALNHDRDAEREAGAIDVFNNPEDESGSLLEFTGGL